MGMFHNLPNGYRHLELDEVESTNTTALQYARNNDPGKLWITAARQLQGKGSRGRSWVSEPGNLYASLLLRKNIAPAKLSTLTFVASLALFDALEIFTPNSKLTLKWPNDLLLNDAKISGILLENHSLQGHDGAAIVGIGVNCASSPIETDHRATNLRAEGIAISAGQIFQLLVVAMDNWLGIWDEGENFAEVRARWLERAGGLGEEIRVKLPDSELHGIFEDLDAGGCLILIMKDQERRAISTADIFFSNHPKKGA